MVDPAKQVRRVILVAETTASPALSESQPLGSAGDGNQLRGVLGSVLVSGLANAPWHSPLSA